MKVVHHSHAND